MELTKLFKTNDNVNFWVSKRGQFEKGGIQYSKGLLSAEPPNLVSVTRAYTIK